MSTSEHPAGEPTSATPLLQVRDLRLRILAVNGLRLEVEPVKD